MKILILCTGNSCRSQMAHGFLQSYNKALNVFSAGTHPADTIQPLAIKVMSEKNVDISLNKPHNISEFIDESWDYVITVCGDANETCPVFFGDVKKRLHMGFEDPSKIEGSTEFIENEFRRVRDELNHAFYILYRDELKDILENQCACGANDFCKCD